MNNNSENINSSIRMSIPKDINDNYSSRKNSSNKIFNSKNNSLLKDKKLPEENRFSIIKNFSKLNSILSLRNTMPHLNKPNYSLLAYTLSRKSIYDPNQSKRNSIYSKQCKNYSKMVEKY